MNTLDDTKQIRRVIPIFFVIDTSGSMAGERIGNVNKAMEEVISDMRHLVEIYKYIQIKISVLEYSDDARWQNPEPIDVTKFVYLLLETYGGTSFSLMLEALNDKLTIKPREYMGEDSPMTTPLILFMSDGVPNDEYEDCLNIIKNNQWFMNAKKAAVAIGDAADIGLLSELTGTKDYIIAVQDACNLPNILRRMIRSFFWQPIGGKSMLDKNENRVEEDNGKEKSQEPLLSIDIDGEE